MKTTRWSQIRDGKLSPDARTRADARARAALAEMTLRELREAAGKTQLEVAELTTMTQSELSRLERRDDHKLSTLRRYVEALGGEVEVVAVIKGRRIALTGV